MAHRLLISFIAAIAVGSVFQSLAEPVFAEPCWEPPVDAAVVDPFRPPACAWCPGNRGLAYGTPPGAVVRSVAAGRVTFAGQVVGSGYVVVELGNGWRVTYGNVGQLTVAAGDTVVAGMLLGRTEGALHFGLRDRDATGADMYLDPEPYLGTWRYRLRLVPLDGPAPAPPAPVLSCGDAPPGR